MSVLLQSIKTEKYVEQSDGWTTQPKQAKQFGAATEALHYCCDHHLKDMKILGQFGDAKMNFSISLTATHLSGATSD